MLKGRNILLGISGGIAAYKVAELTRLFVRNGANVKVIMTPMSKEFITPLTMATLSRNPVLVDFYKSENGDWNSHVNLGLWADVFIIAPATANTIGKMANAIADNLLITTYMSAKCPVFVAPSMDLDMFIHPSNQQNIAKLKTCGNIIIQPPEGELASGLIGKGRMEEPENIFEIIKDFFQKKKSLNNKKILITAGPSYEKIDAVRFIGNYSSGKMGYAIAEELADRGADVTLVSGPSNQSLINQNIKLIKTNTAQEMYDVCVDIFEKQDAAIMSAAVADYTPVNAVKGKIKKENKNLSINLKPTKDIAEKLGSLKRKNQVIAGFALEKDNEIDNAVLKLKKKNLNFVVLNSLNKNNTCFNSDLNKVTIIYNKKRKYEFVKKQKRFVAKDIADHLEMEFSKFLKLK